VTAVPVDVLVIGGGPAGSVLGSLLARAGRSVVIVERDHHPRDHVGESLTPSSNFVWKRIGFLDKMEAAGFVHKPGSAWTAPRAPVGKFVSIRLNEFPMPGAPLPYTFNIERDVFDAMLLSHAQEQGASVRQGVRAEQVLMRDGRATGARVRTEDGRVEDVGARFVVDASGRRCLLASQLGLRASDPFFSQFAVWTWFRGAEPLAPGTEGMILLHFLDMERAWAWQIPLRDGVWSVGFVTDRDDFRKAGTSTDEWVAALTRRNATLRHNMRHAEQLRPWRLEADYSYRISRLSGPGWLLIGDALRFVDPVFSTGVDVATYSAMHAFEAVDAVLNGAGEAEAFARYEHTVVDGVDAWYDLIRLFYELQNLFTYYVLRKDTREKVVRIVQGNPYDPVALERAREMIALMRGARDRALADPRSLLRPGAIVPVG
jgi:1H-pyrrole-2-carbonyl-[peptidyl-carrier protein] chlorinase